MNVTSTSNLGSEVHEEPWADRRPQTAEATFHDGSEAREGKLRFFRGSTVTLLLVASAQGFKRINIGAARGCPNQFSDWKMTQRLTKVFVEK